MVRLFRIIFPLCVAVLLFSGAHAAHAAIVFDNSTASPYSNNGTLTWTHVTTSTANTILFVGLNEFYGLTVATVTYNSVPMTLIGEQSNGLTGTNKNVVYLYDLVNPTAGSHTVSVTFANNGDYVEGISTSYAGASQTSQPDNFTTNNVNVTSSYSNQYTTLTTNADNSWGIEIAQTIAAVNAISSEPSTQRSGLSFNDGAMFDTNGPTTPPGSMSINAVPQGTGQEIMVMASFAPYVAPPNAPQSLAATPSNNQVTLNWSAPSGGGAPSSYLVYDKITASSTYNFYASTTASSPSSIVSGLTNGINYSFEVFSDNTSGTSTPATATSTPNPGPPNPPQSLMATAGFGQVALSWAAPSSNGGSTITQYLVYDKLTASSTFSFYASTTLSQTTSTVINLTNDQNYSFQVFAQNMYGTSTAATASATPSNFATSTTIGGNWSATSSWLGGVVPGDGYYVTIQGPVVINQNIGTVGGGGIKNITLTGTSTTLSVNTSSPRTILFGSTGNNPEGSGSATAPGQDANMYGFFVLNQSQLLLVGTQADPITIEAANGTSPIFINSYGVFNGITTPPGGDLRMIYDDVYNLGTNSASSTSDFPGISWFTTSNETSTDFIDIEHSRFTSPYEVLSLPNNVVAESLTFSSNYITGRSGPDTVSMFEGAGSPDLITDNTEVAPVTLGYFFAETYEPTNLELLRNAVSGTNTTAIGLYAGGGSLGSGSNTIQYNLLYNYLNGLTYDSTGFGDSHINELVGNSDDTALVDSNVAENTYQGIDDGGTISNNYICTLPSTSQGEIFLSQDTSNDVVQKNVLVYDQALPSQATSFGLWTWNGGGGATTPTGQVFQHNTVIGSSASSGVETDSSGIEIGDGGGGPSFDVTVRSNLVYDVQYGISANGGGADTFSNDYAGVGVHHNDVFDYGIGQYEEQTGTVGFDNGTTLHPNAIYGDVSLNPGFFDPTRTSTLQYDSRVLGGPGTATDLFTQLGERSGWGGSYASTSLAANTADGNPINDIRKWLFAGYVPTNLAIATSGADGLPDGAENMGLTSLLPGSLPNGTTSVPYSQLLTATGDAAPYTWSVSSGTLPTGLSLATSSTNSTTTISGTPTVAGTTNFSIQVQGSMGTSIAQNYNLTISGGALSISPTTLPTSTFGIAYSQLLTASGGLTPFTWSVFSGGLPAGLSLATSTTNSTTTISGTPTAAGVSNFTIQVQSGGATTTRAYTLNTVATTSTPPQSLLPTPGNTQVGLSWSAPASNGGASVSQYDVWDKLTASSTYLEFATTTLTNATVTSLTNGSNYSFEVFAENSVGSSTVSNIVTSTPSTVPSAPTIGTATPGNAQVSVAFTPNSNGGSSVLYYTATSNPSNITATSSGSPVLVTGLTNGQAYTFTVTATNANGTSASSGASGSVTPSAALTSITPATLPTSTATVLYSQILTVNGGLTPYTWSISIGTLPTGISLATSSTNGTTTLSGTPTIVGTSTFTVEVQSGAASTTQAYLFTVASPTVPTAPQSLAATPGDTQVALTWSDPASTGGSSLTQYLVEDRLTGTSTFTQYATTTPSTTGATVTGLTNGTSYDFAVIAQNSIGTSTISNIASSTPAAAPSSGGGGTITQVASGGGGGMPPVAPIITSSSTTPTTASLEAELASLEAQLQVLLGEASGQTVSVTTTSSSGPLGGIFTTPFTFTYDLQLNDVNVAVSHLQRYLNTHGFPVASTGWGSLGYEINRFGPATYAALRAFQASVGIRAAGYFGIITRGYVNSHP